MIKHCPRCSNAMELKTLERVSAADEPLKLSVSGMPAARCPKGHAAPVDRDFMLWLIHELKARSGALPGGEAKGMLFKKYHCACGGELGAKPGQTRAFPFELAYKDSPAFKAEIEMPVYKCAKCGKEQLRSTSEVQKHTSQAIAALNDAAGFPHSA